ncbi:uncharacterized protein [Dermacentor andersoni]|uniref:uncharacterized protein isoform X2 n=1 Tax=Dermacentor andersoni TaxID=34620 RepID=UPI002415C8AF|nr:uncharacterized protein LOC129380298 isoform X2 [Dermacentor andersoni]
MESSPLPLQSLARLRTSAMSTAETTPAADQPCTSHGEPLLHAKSMASAPPTALALFQEHVQVLRQNLVGAEQTLDTTDPDELRLLKKALIQVSKMISQMESVANTLEQRRLNLRNELRTLEDENSQLKKALFRERRKTLNKKANDPPLLGERMTSPPPPFYRGESNADYDSLRQFLFAPTILSASTSKVSTVFGVNPGTSGKAKRGRGGSPTGRSANNVMGGKHSGSVKRGWGTAAARARPRPLLRTLTGVETGGASSSAAPVPALNDVMLLGGSAPAMTPIALTPPPLPTLEQNEIDDLAQRLRNRNNKFAGKKEEAFTIIEWNASID